MFVAIAAIALSAQGGSWPPDSRVSAQFITFAHTAPPVAGFWVYGPAGTAAVDITLSAPPRWWWQPASHAGGGGDRGGGQGIGLYPMPGTVLQKFDMQRITMTWTCSNGNNGIREEDIVMDGRTAEEKANAPKLEEVFDVSMLMGGDLAFKQSIDLAAGSTLNRDGLTVEYRVGSGPYQPMNVRWETGSTNFIASVRDFATRLERQTTIRIIYRQTGDPNDPNFAWGTYTVNMMDAQPTGRITTSQPRNGPFNLRRREVALGVRG